MSAHPFVGQIMLVAGYYPPAGWAFCDGQLLPINQYKTLFFIIGTTYGGDGQETFALPDLRGSLPLHTGQGPGLTPRVLANKAGEETATIIAPQLPVHAHAALGTTTVGSSAVPTSLLPAVDAAGSLHYAVVGDVALAPEAIGPQGGDQPHANMQPTLAIHFCIALDGVFPSPA
jgi:microcystin-dependent protein